MRVRRKYGRFTVSELLKKDRTRIPDAPNYIIHFHMMDDTIYRIYLMVDTDTTSFPFFRACYDTRYENNLALLFPKA